MEKLTQEKIEELFRKASENFKLEDIKTLLGKAKELFAKFQDNEKLKEFLSDYKLLIEMIKDYYNGEYREVPMYVIAAIGGTLLYILSPIDLIPDFLPVIGYLDDAAVFAFCLKMIGKELEMYKKWKETKKENI